MARRLAVLAVLAVSCAAETQAAPPPAPTATTASIRPSAAAAPPSTTTTTITTTTTAAPSPAFSARISAVTATDLGGSWREGCPVGPGDLRQLDVAHWDDAGGAAIGTLVAHAEHVEDLVTVFELLFEAGFPIHSMRPVHEFGADDAVSMAANNTSAFNCRTVAGTGRWSEHAHGTAIDVNPLVNPWVRGGVVDPPEGSPYADRAVDAAGMVHADGVVVGAFASIDWSWGGDWSSAKDYQHFSASGR